MASLKKPELCINGCISVEFKKEKKPERWICTLCEETVAQRAMRNPTGVCRVCGVNNKETKFHKHGNICADCKSDYNTDYRAENNDKILAKKKEWYQNLPEGEAWRRTKRCIERCPESFLADQMYHIKSRSDRPEHGPNPSCPIKRQHDLDRDFLREMWESQDGKCALTKVPMIYKFGSLESASIDRIDSSLGHVKGNIQLVCLGINRLKHTFSNAEVSEFLEGMKL